MTPDSPQDPQKGKAGEADVPRKRPRRPRPPRPRPRPPTSRSPSPSAAARRRPQPEAEGQAAEETGVDKEAAEATEEKPKPKRRRVAAEDKNPEGTKPEGTKKKAAAAATEGDVKEAAAAQPRKRDRRRRPEPGVLVRAQAKYVRTSARKARLVCDHIRGKDVVEARAILAFTPRAAAKPWLKLLESAVANAEHNHELVGDDLSIAAVHADEGPTLKRYRPRAMGRATRIRKRTSHLTITLTPKES